MPERVRIRNRQRRLSIDPRPVRRLLEAVLAGEGVAPGRPLEVALLRDGALAEMNARFRGRPGPTDVLSFPADPRGWPPEEPRPLGEIVVSVDRACEQAAARGLAPARELERLLVHGALHLTGYDDHTPAERARMRRREERYLRLARGRQAPGARRARGREG